jgi:surface protein
MAHMFCWSKFNSDISKWDISNVEEMWGMFCGSKFNQDLSKWDISNVENMSGMFNDCPIKDEYKPKFNK